MNALRLRGTRVRTVRSSRLSTVVVRAQEDPYKLLGIPTNADSNTINRLYKQKLFEAKTDEQKAAIESAHSAIMMNLLTRRVKGGSPVDKDIQFADKTVIFPWRPKRAASAKEEVAAHAAICGLTLAWLLAIPMSGFQPLQATMLGMLLMNIWKQYQFFPVAQGEKDATAKGWRNLLRGAGMTLGSAAAGIFLFYSLPDLLASVAGRALPFWFYESQALICTIAANSLMFVLGSFYR